VQTDPKLLQQLAVIYTARRRLEARASRDDRLEKVRLIESKKKGSLQVFKKSTWSRRHCSRLGGPGLAARTQQLRRRHAAVAAAAWRRGLGASQLARF